MDLQTTIIIAIAIVIAGVVYSLPTIIRIIQVRRTPTTWMNALPEQGRVEVNGKVSQNVTESPIGKTPCAAWQIEVEQLHRDNKGRTSWSTCLKKNSSERFTLEDDLGKVQVQPDEDADWTLADDNDLGLLESDQAYILTDRFNFDTVGIMGGEKTLRGVERLLVAGDQAYVMGMVSTENGDKVISAVNSGFVSSLTISDKSEAQVIRTMLTRVGVNMLVAVVVAALEVLFLSKK